MELTIGYWQISIKRIWPSSDQLAAMYNKAAPRWHTVIQRLGYCHAYSRLFQRLTHGRVLDHLEDASIVLDGSFTSEALSAWLAEAGLKDIRFYPFTTGWSRWTSFACLGFKV